MSAGDSGKDWTVLELLDWTTNYFDDACIENPRLNAEVLLGKVLGLERIMLYARFDRQVQPGQRREFRELVKKRADRCPLQYLLGETEFYGRDFTVTPAVLIPRPETELVVDKCLEKLPDEAAAYRIADVGTGSGAIAVTLALERPSAQVLGTDSSAEALEVAAQNAHRHDVKERVGLLEGELTEPVEKALEKAGKKLHLLVSNPPYIPSDQVDELEPEVRDHEPREALDGGEDGLDFVRKLVHQAGPLLESGGWLVLELSEGQADSVREILQSREAFSRTEAETEVDRSGCERVLAVEKTK